MVILGYAFCGRDHARKKRFLTSLLLLIASLSVNNALFGQKLSYKNIYIGIDAIQKWTFQKTEPKGLNIWRSIKEFNTDRWVDVDWLSLPDKEITIGYRAKRMDLELSYRMMEYHAGFGIVGGGGYDRNFEKGAHYTARGVWKPFRFGLLKRDFSLKLGLGCTYVKSYGYYGFLGDGVVTAATETMTFTTEERVGVNYGFYKRFALLEGQLKCQWDVSKRFSINFGGGYVQGFKTLAISKVEYVLNGAPAQHIETTINGTNAYYSVGLRFPVGKFIEKGIENRKKKK